MDEDCSFVVEGMIVANCMSRCACELEIEQIPGTAQDVAPDADLPHGRRDDGEPITDRQAAQIDDVRSRINYWRREVETADSAEDRREAIRERQRANDELIDLQQRMGVRDVPMLSVGDVLGERDLRREAVDDLLERGLTSTELDALSATEREAAEAEFRRLVEQFLSRSGT